MESSPIASGLGSRLHRALDAGRSVITAELAVPATVAHELLIERARGLLRPQIVAVNLTDGLRGRPALSPIAAAAILTHADLGVEPIVQLVARSRARNALIADLLGASALGVRNVLCMTGDVPESSADIQDVDVFSLIELARGFPAALGVELLGVAEPFCVGAAWSPFAPDPLYETSRLVRKHAAGAQFVQTQPVFDGRAFAAAVDRMPAALADLPLIVGLAPVRSCDHARRLMAIPGIVIPARLVALLDRASDEADACERYWAYLDEELDWLARNAPVRGCHLMPIGHSKRGIRQTSSFDRLYAAATKTVGVSSPSSPDVAPKMGIVEPVFGTPVS
ncbi:MAG TPA: methylenetetrahydrofolate reductase [Candidatus Limnocylindria bacterium]|jgi:methylenetetrahydrofolate reductase (NADPH)|nr:methylenetetrahydrofolate reductase [Candidatus Limnocylindria bacterium]